MRRSFSFLHAAIFICALRRRRSSDASRCKTATRRRRHHRRCERLQPWPTNRLNVCRAASAALSPPICSNERRSALHARACASERRHRKRNTFDFWASWRALARRSEHRLSLWSSLLLRWRRRRRRQESFASKLQAAAAANGEDVGGCGGSRPPTDSCRAASHAAAVSERARARVWRRPRVDTQSTTTSRGGTSCRTRRRPKRRVRTF